MNHLNKVAIVTGGASGIGEGVVRRLAKEGARVVIADIDADRGRAIASELGSNCRFQRCDVQADAEIDRLIAESVSAFGQLDIMVNNAAVMHVAPLVETDADAWRRMFAVNVHGVFLGSRAAARQMVKQGSGGIIINGSSGAGRHGVPYFSAYCATKAAIINMSQAFAQELAPHRIRVNCYTPGHIMTPFWDQIAAGYGKWTGKSRDEVIAAFRATVPWGRFGTPEDVAAAVSWLCTTDAEYVSGQCIAMNGAELPW